MKQKNKTSKYNKFLVATSSFQSQRKSLKFANFDFSQNYKNKIQHKICKKFEHKCKKSSTLVIKKNFFIDKNYVFLYDINVYVYIKTRGWK